MKSLLGIAALCALLSTGARAEELAPALVPPGEPLPMLSGVDLDGNPLDLFRYLGKGTVVLSFWSIHCADCIRELDDLSSIRREFPPTDVTLVAVNTDSGLPHERIAGFIRRYEAASGKLDVVHLLDRNAAIVEKLGIRYIPLLVVVDRSSRVSSVITGYSPADRPRVAQAMENGRVALGAWSDALRGRLLTLLRGPGPIGRSVEWGSFRVEQQMALFGLYDGSGWIADAAGRRDRAVEAKRVEGVVADLLKLALLRESLASVGIRLSGPASQPQRAAGLEVPESPLEIDTPWKRLFEALSFGDLYREQEGSGAWVGDEYWGGLVGDVDLGRLRARLSEIGFPYEPSRIRLETASDFDYKPRALLSQLQRASVRLQAIQGEHLVYFGAADRLAAELRELDGRPLKVYVEVVGPETVRVEVL